MASLFGLMSVAHMAERRRKQFSDSKGAEPSRDFRADANGNLTSLGLGQSVGNSPNAFFPLGTNGEDTVTIRQGILELRYQQEIQQGEALQAVLSALRAVEAELDADEEENLLEIWAGFVANLQLLAERPESLRTRRQVFEGAGLLAGRLQDLSRRLERLQTELNRRVRQTVGEISTRMQGIARLNQQTKVPAGAGLQGGRGRCGQLVDAVRELSRLMDVGFAVEADGTATISTPQGCVLVRGPNHYPLETQVLEPGQLERVVQLGCDITGQIDGGRLGGELRARDEIVDDIMVQLDTLAHELCTRCNSALAGKYDLQGFRGRNLFLVPPSVRGAARSMTLAVSGPEELPASPGSKGNSDAGKVGVLSRLASRALSDGRQAMRAWQDRLVRLSEEIRSISADLEAGKLSREQLENQREADSAVLLDDEAVTLIRFQRAFEASARVVGLVEGLTRSALHPDQLE